MATIPTFTTVRAGIDKLTAALWNGQVVTAFNFLLGAGAGSKDYCTLRQQNSQSIANLADVPVSFDVEETDHAGGFSLVTPTRYYAQTNGNFRMSGALGFLYVNVTGYRQGGVRITHLDGSTTFVYAGAVAAVNGTETVMAVSCDFPMVIGEYAEAILRQSSGAALGTFAGNASRPGPRVTFEWVSVT